MNVVENPKRNEKVQCRLNEKERNKFEEIRQVILFEKQSGNRMTPFHGYAKEDRVTDADVIRFLINNYEHRDW
jgi:hypothetical protein